MSTPRVTRIETVTGGAMSPYFDDVARLRIAVFREYPYLYDGTVEEEREYLDRYLRSPRSVWVLAFSEDDGGGERVVGASTANPMSDEDPLFRKPFEEDGRFDPARVFYLGESVLEPAYRGQGVGHAFMDAREAHARGFGDYRWMAFCAVDRPADHPLRPSNYRPLDAFWQKRGYVKHPELRTTFDWKQIDEDVESPKPMVFWLRELSA